MAKHRIGIIVRGRRRPKHENAGLLIWRGDLATQAVLSTSATLSYLGTRRRLNALKWRGAAGVRYISLEKLAHMSAARGAPHREAARRGNYPARRRIAET